MGGNVVSHQSKCFWSLWMSTSPDRILPVATRLIAVGASMQTDRQSLQLSVSARARLPAIQHPLDIVNCLEGEPTAFTGRSPNASVVDFAKLPAPRLRRPGSASVTSPPSIPLHQRRETALSSCARLLINSLSASCPHSKHESRRRSSSVSQPILKQAAELRASPAF